MANNRIITRVNIKADAQGNAPTSIQLLHSGSWFTPWHGDFEITAGDIHEYVANFEAGTGLVKDSKKAPINYGHKSGDKAGGWITGLYAQEADGVTSLWGNTSWTPEGERSIKEEEYCYISPEFNPRSLPWEDPEQEWHFVPNVLTGAGLTNIPLFKKLKPVMASARPDGNNSNQGEPMKFKLEEVRVKKASDLSADEKAFLETKKSELNEAELKSFGLKADEAPENKPEPKKPVAASVEGQVSISADELAQLKADAQQGVDAARQLAETQAGIFASARISAGQIKSDQKDSLVKILLASKGDTRKELETFVQGLPENKIITAGELGSSEGGEGGTASEQLMVKANKIVADSDGKITIANAMKQVLASDSGLREQVNAERK
jgi:hypothetical protein